MYLYNISILFLSTRAKQRLAYQHIISAAVYNVFVAWDSCIKTSVAQHVHKISVGLLLVTGVALPVDVYRKRFLVIVGHVMQTRGKNPSYHFCLFLCM